MWNLFDGVDIYRVADTLVHVGKLSLKIRKNFVVQIVMGPQGSAITGSDSGEIYIWDIERREKTHILSHGKGQPFPEWLVCHGVLTVVNQMSRQSKRSL